MELKYLGTAAAEGIPAIFCDCETCRAARNLGGRNIRTRSQALVDGKLLLDFPADSLAHALAYGLDYSRVSTLLITHIHEDHFYPADFSMRRPGFGHLDGLPPLDVYGSEDIGEPLEKCTASFAGQTGEVKIHTVAPREPFAAEGYRVTALEAVHGTPHPYFYMIEKDGSALLYAHDTDVFPEQVWDYLAAAKPRLGLVSLDCTEGARHIDYHGHMNLERAAQVKARLGALGLTDSRTVFCLNHFSHNAGNVLYAPFCALAEKNGFLVSYDGMSMVF